MAIEQEPTKRGVVKCRREGYAEDPFFFLEPKGETPYAVCWLPDPAQLQRVYFALLKSWPQELECHFEAPVHPQDDGAVHFDLFGDLRRDDLLSAARKHATVLFRDGGVRLRVWRKDTDDCLGIDEHGLLFYWAKPDLARGALAAQDIEERKGPLIQDEEHWHSEPEGADATRGAFVEALRIGGAQ